MDRRLRSIVVVGGGTAGWMSAAALAKVSGRDLEIILVESEEIGTVGVGEATIPAIMLFNKLLEIDEDEFVRETNATFKLGIEFNDWRRLGHTYFHQFGLIGAAIDKGVSFSDYWLRWVASGGGGPDPDILQFNAETVAARLGKFGRSLPTDRTGLPAINYAFQFDASLYAAYLRRFAEKRGVRRVEGKIVKVHQNGESGFIEAVELTDGRKVLGDFFFDCSGFRALLIEGALEAGFEDWSQWLPCNRAAAVPCERVEEPTPFTRSTAREAGWQWRIPLQHRTGNGYVFSNEFISEDEATTRLMERLDGAPRAEPRVLRFTAGQRKRNWVKNCLAVGLASGFLEPLESTSIHLVQAAVTKFLDFFPDRDCKAELVDRFNEEMHQAYGAIRDFLIAHFHVTERDDTPFWAYCKNMSIPDSLQTRIDLFKARGSALPEFYDLFREGSWFAVLWGQGIRPESYHALANSMPEDQLLVTLKNVRAAIQERVDSMSTHQEVLDRITAAPKTFATR
ncbi:MAG: tryptophan halogenase family protein [Pseudomonadota bacterium]